MTKLTRVEKIRYIALKVQPNGDGRFIHIALLFEYLKRGKDFFDNCLILIDSWTADHFFNFIIDIKSEQSIDNIFNVVLSQELETMNRTKEKEINSFFKYEEEFGVSEYLVNLK